MRSSVSARRSRGRIAIVVAALVAPVAASVARAATCAPAVSVEGDEPARGALAAELARAHMGPPTEPDCPVGKVSVRAEGKTLDLVITDQYGRVSHHAVADLATAAALVESTPGAEVLEPLLPAVELQRQARVMPGAAEVEPEESSAPASPVSVSSAPAEHSAGRGLSLLVATEAAAGSDGSQWAGLAISGCVALAATCLGTRVHLWHDLDAAGESGNAVGQRATGAIALSLDVPFTRHHLEVRPGVELGLGWIHMGRFAVHPSSDSDFDQGEVLAGVHVGAAYPLTHHWALEGGLGATLSVFAHRAPFMVQGMQLPGEPFAFAVASLGVRYGSP